MENRGQKRADMPDDELPADKRPCSSLDSAPGSSNSSNQSHSLSSNAPSENNASHMDTSSATSSAASDSSEYTEERDSAYASVDSENLNQRHRSLQDYQRGRCSSDQRKLNSILESLSGENDASTKLVLLTELCEVLSFCTENSLSGMIVDSLSPILVNFAKDESNPDIMLFATRAITYLCDLFPQASGFLVRHDVVPTLCQRLMAIEYLDLAEQCLQALDKLSKQQPLACLQAGAIMAVLTYIDFFSTSIQRVAVSTILNICQKLPSECPAPFMEAVPVLCNLLQYEDMQLVENIVTCLIKITKRVSHSSEMLDELCKHGLILQATHLISLNSRTTLSQPIYNSLIGLLVKLSFGSVLAFKTLYELDISGVLKEILLTFDLSHGVSSLVVDGQGNQLHELLKFLNGLVPTSAEECDQHVSDQEAFLVENPNLLQKFGVEILPIMIQVVNSGANIHVCYGCLSVVNKVVFLSKSEALFELLKDANISSFLAGVFTKKDQHVHILALQIAEKILKKLPEIFLSSFIKEGVLFSIDAFISPERYRHMIFPVVNGIQLPVDSSQGSETHVVHRCLCNVFGTVRHTSESVSETKTCNLGKNAVQDLAKHIRNKYFIPDVSNSESGFTDSRQNLKILSSALHDLMNSSENAGSSTQDEEKFYSLLHHILLNLSGKESVSTFELIDSGIIKSLLNYMLNGQYLSKNLNALHSNFHTIEKRLEIFARLFLSSSDALGKEAPLIVLVQKLQSALSSVENFPVMLTHLPRRKTSFATVPNGRNTVYSSLRVCFVRENGETCLRDYSAEDVVTVDPLSTFDAIEGYLWPKVWEEKNAERESKIQVVKPIDGPSSELQPEANSNHEKNSDPMESDSMSTALAGMQVSTGQQVQLSSAVVTNFKSKNWGSHSILSVSPKLVFCLEGKQLDRDSTIYQAILEQKIRLGHEVISGDKLWTQVYTIKYRMATKPDPDDHQKISFQSDENVPVSKNFGIHSQNSSFLSCIFDAKLYSDLDTGTATFDILFMLKILETLNRFAFHLISQKRISAFVEGSTNDLEYLRVVVQSVPQNEFMSCKLTTKLEQQMRDNLAISVGGIPMWCNQLMTWCPFLFSFETKRKYFRLSAFGRQQVQAHLSSHSNSSALRSRSPIGGGHRKKFLVSRNKILESAAEMMDLHAGNKVPLEVEYHGEVGTGLGPTLEFYTLVSNEFQKLGNGMWREDASRGLFPCPWPYTVATPYTIPFSEDENRFSLLGQVVAKALQDERVLDLPLSKAFYKLILGQDLNLYDIQSFDPALGKTLLEFQALASRNKHLGSSSRQSLQGMEPCYRNVRIEDLYLDFTLPGYPNYVLTYGPDYKTVNIDNLEDYVKLVTDATIHTGISSQFEAFKSGFNQVFPIQRLHIFSEEEVERLLCGEFDVGTFNKLLDHVKLDHGYTASSQPVISLMEIIEEFSYEQRRAFLQFVTGTPRLPPGGLATLNPKMTIVRKICSDYADRDLPSVMTCVNYLKLPPYSSKATMKEKLLYAITEGQGSFHLS